MKNTKKALIITLSIVLAVVIIATCGFAYASDYVKKNTIGLDAAISTAMADAGCTEDTTEIDNAKLTLKNGALVYEVDFTSEGNEYEYLLNAADGAVINIEKDGAKTEAQLTDVTSANNTQNSDSATYITVDKAKEIALSDAGVAAKDATFTKAEKDYDDGVSCYDIEFNTATNEYEYEISLNGDILSKDKEPLEGTANKNSSANNTQNSGSATDITVDKAKEIALSNAGVAAKDATFTKAKKDYDDGVSCYDIEFYTAKYEYEYEISMKGSVLSSDKEARKSTSSVSSADKPDSTKYIGVDKAKEAALKHAGLSASSVRFTKAKLENEDGVMVYEIDFVKGSYEYEYEINAKTGKVVSYDKEYDDN